MKRQRGFTLVELMVSVSVIGTFVLASTGVVLSIRKTETVSGAYGRDLAELRRAVRVVEEDLRGATEIADLDVRLDGGRLVRGTRVLARNVAVFEVTRDGSMARVRIGLGARSGTPGKRGELTFTVRMRNAERRR